MVTGGDGSVALPGSVAEVRPSDNRSGSRIAAAVLRSVSIRSDPIDRDAVRVFVSVCSGVSFRVLQCVCVLNSGDSNGDRSEERNGNRVTERERAAPWQLWELPVIILPPILSNFYCDVRVCVPVCARASVCVCVHLQSIQQEQQPACARWCPSAQREPSFD